MILTNPDISYLIGGESDTITTFPPFFDLQMDFLCELSSRLRDDTQARRHSDVLSFAFWCRRGNLQRLREKFIDGHARLGLGAVFHISPSNVPVNFAFSYAFGLLAGNTNYVRVPSNNYHQVAVICDVLKQVLALPRFELLRPTSHFFRYRYNLEITAEISSRCRGRVVWGGNESIREIRKSPIDIRGVDIAFADRYSLCCLGAKHLAGMSEVELDRLALDFYNDTYLMDQNACSSPHLVIWVGEPSDISRVQKEFWKRVLRIVKQRYRVSAKAAVDKQMLFCRNVIDIKDVREVDIGDTALYRIELGSLPKNIDTLRGHSGYFYEYGAKTIDDISTIVNSTYQTLTYAGIEKSFLLDFIVKNRLAGIDRIVRVGTALNVGIVWDGLHVIQALSRIIDVD